MRIKIIKNDPQENDCSSIEHLVGQEFDVVDSSDIDLGIVYIKYEYEDKYTIYNEEYELVSK